MSDRKLLTELGQWRLLGGAVFGTTDPNKAHELARKWTHRMEEIGKALAAGEEDGPCSEPFDPDAPEEWR